MNAYTGTEITLPVWISKIITFFMLVRFWFTDTSTMWAIKNAKEDSWIPMLHIKGVSFKDLGDSLAFRHESQAGEFRVYKNFYPNNEALAQDLRRAFPTYPPTYGTQPLRYLKAFGNHELVWGD
jgi:hypothetical protein